MDKSACAIKDKLARKELQTAPNTRGKSEVWASFDLVVTLTNEPTGFAQCKTCKHVLSFDSKSTGTSHLARHSRGCSSNTGAESSSRQLPIPNFIVKSAPTTAKKEVTQKCITMCCEDIRPFETVAGGGFLQLAQELINTGATYGRVSAADLLPDPTYHCVS